MLIMPLAQSLWYSFTDYNLIQGVSSFVGLKNYQRILTDPDMIKAIWNTLVFTVSAITLEMLLGLGIALILNRELRGRRFITTAFMLPMLITPSIIALIWQTLFWNMSYGLINYGLSLFGIPPQPWLSDEKLAMIAVILTEVWEQTPFVGLIILSGLQALPVAPFEAATIDGASRLQKLRHITLPLLKPVIMVALLFRTIFTLRVFDLIFILTAGGPGTATYVISIAIQQEFFNFFNVGVASAMSWILLIISAVISLIYIKILYTEMGEF
ncbi:MAG: sugar ABC transporter permease [Nitrososphaeria archaeon]|nr:sugar ABC transporter permease [Nitrososphaeria archaeon]